MKQYQVPYHEPISFVHAPLAEIDSNPWGAIDPPKTVFQASFPQKFGFLFQITSFEKNPKRVYRHNGEDVWTDSCAEAFINFAPDRSKTYLNIEIGAGGGMLIGVGEGRENRRPVTDFAPYPECNITLREDMWAATALIPLSLIEAVYGKIDFKPGYRFTGNFNKCLEEGKGKHFLTWNPVDTPEPDFHRPEAFGELILA